MHYSAAGADVENDGSQFEQVRQAMTRRAKQLLKEYEVGDNATIKVPIFDRGPNYARNLLVVVMNKSNDLYKVECKEGSLHARYTAADLDLTKASLISVIDVPDVELPLRTAISTPYT